MRTSALPSDSLATRVARNFLTHSGHVPVVMLILELLLAKPGYFSSLDPYLLLAAGLLQALLTEWCEQRGRPAPFLTNLFGPLVYTAFEAGMEGSEFFLQWHHQAYWCFAFGFGLLQWARHVQEGRGGNVAPLLLAESILRSAITIVMYALFEARIKGAGFSLPVFFHDLAHEFLSIVLVLLGTLLGFAEIGLRRSMLKIRELTERLHQYSEWTLGSRILARAIEDESTLALQRVERAVLFIDIRGFTGWAETQAPERVVGMLNDYYRLAEAALAGSQPIKIKYTADEVMAVFAAPRAAIEAGLRILEATTITLQEAGLVAGAGVHAGPVVEGMLGGEGTRAYDFIGDTVNTAQRLCDAAGGSELLASAAACRSAGVDGRARRQVAAKGKKDALDAVVFEASGAAG